VCGAARRRRPKEARASELYIYKYKVQMRALL